jgi:hypothetical protein
MFVAAVEKIMREFGEDFGGNYVTDIPHPQLSQSVFTVF